MLCPQRFRNSYEEHGGQSNRKEWASLPIPKVIRYRQSNCMTYLHKTKSTSKTCKSAWNKDLSQDHFAPRESAPPQLIDQRVFCVVDLENLCGGSAKVPANSKKFHDWLMWYLEPYQVSQIVIATGTDAFRGDAKVRWDWEPTRWLVGHGIDGADMRLADVLLNEPTAANCDRIIICSGDGYFTQAAKTLSAKGCHVEVISSIESTSRELRQAASSSIVYRNYFTPVRSLTDLCEAA